MTFSIINYIKDNYEIHQIYEITPSELSYPHFLEEPYSHRVSSFMDHAQL